MGGGGNLYKVCTEPVVPNQHWANHTCQRRITVTESSLQYSKWLSFAEQPTWEPESHGCCGCGSTDNLFFAEATSDSALVRSVAVCVLSILQRKRRVSDGEIAGSSDGGGSNNMPQINPHQALQQVRILCAFLGGGYRGSLT